jgi:hypothetical protein
VNRVQDRQRFLEFVSDLTRLLASYGPDDLKGFVELSHRGFALLTPVIAACARVAGGRTPGPTSPKEESALGSSDGDLAHIREAIQSRELFATNRDVGAFAAQVVGERRRWDKMGRAETADRVVAYLLQHPGRRGAVESEILGRAARLERSGGSSFFSRWENVIKGIER